MRILNEGDKSKAVCVNCKVLVDITYRNGFYRKSDRKTVILGYCDVCGEMATIPAESATMINVMDLGLDDHGE